MNALHLRIATDDAIGLQLRPVVDGIELLGEYANGLGPDPDRLLPPLSSALLPTTVGRTALVGVCSCGESGCGSLHARISRIGSSVGWDPCDAPDESLARSYRFPLIDYLDAVDRAVDDLAAIEGRGLRIARRVRLALRGWYEHQDTLATFAARRIDWVSAWPWTSDVVRASITGSDGQQTREYTANAGESDDAFAARVVADLSATLLPRA